MFTRQISLAFALISASLAAGQSHAETYQTCAGFIDSVPATITTQGTWCLRHDLATSISSGSAISINTNNVTIDCNHYKIGGLGAGASTTAVGVSASNRLNLVVRNCSVRGFANAINLTGSGALVEDNRLDGNTQTGIYVSGDGGIIQRNQIFDTGSSTAGVPDARGIVFNFNVDVLDNRISSVFADVPDGYPAMAQSDGIKAGANATGLVANNRITGVGYFLEGAGSATFADIRATDGISDLRINDNYAHGDDFFGGSIIVCYAGSPSRARGNNVSSVSGCVDDGNFQ
jgi:hypothetical protein